MKDSIGVGQLGYGGIGKVHAHAYRSIPHYYPGALPDIRFAAVGTSSEKSAEKAVNAGGYARGYSDIEKLVSDETVDVIDCSLPNFAHKEVLRIALAAGKHVYCEKPLCLDVKEAAEIAEMAAASTAKVGMTFNYRFVPAVMRAKQLIEGGAVGEVYNYQFVYLHTGYQDESRPLSWRMQKELSGGGALVDLGSHVIDLARYLLGDFAEVSATSKTLVEERPLSKGSAEKGRVTVDDAMWLQARLTGGAVGTFEVSRFATGSLDDLWVRIEGSAGALKFDLMDANWLYYYDASRKGEKAGWMRLETVTHYPGAVIPTPRSILGWERTHTENQFRFLKSIVEDEEPSPGLSDGIAVQLFMAAAYESADRGGWIPVPEL